MKELLKEKLATYQSRVESGLSEFLPPPTARPEQLHKAMRYSIEAGGKRIRPVLLLATSELFGFPDNALPAAVAIECLHTYTLIHDDLPSLDDSDLRRGRPSCHAKFDEATAILAGDALLTFAFQLISREYRDQPVLAGNLIGDLAEASGSEQLIGGQMEDILNEGHPIDADTLRYIHENKTAALLTAALKMGLRFCDPNKEQISLVETVGLNLGLSFQIVDDILDATSDAQSLGKPAGNDAAAEKSTYVSLYGIDQARTIARAHTESAIQAAKEIGGDIDFIVSLIADLESRIN
ncbi:MAG: polyprenyl synthetase family protein [Verrucomicrobiota bacterium]